MSVLDRLGSSTSGGRRVINLREESSFPPRPEPSSTTASSGMARAVSSAITSAQRSVCVLPSSTSSSGKKLEVREFSHLWLLWHFVLVNVDALFVVWLRLLVDKLSL